MSELNITNILSNTLYAVLDAYTKPMLAHIAEQDERIAVLEQRITDTENKLTNTRALLLELSNRMAEMTQAQPAQETNLLPIEQRVYTVDQVKAIVAKEVYDAIEAHLENAPHHDEDYIANIADDKLQDHCNDYDHDQFITEIDEDTVRDAVRVCLEDARVSISIR